MAIDKVTVANLALQFVGAKRISSFNEDSREARAINAVYDSIRDEVLSVHPWTFALQRVALAQLDEVPAFDEDGMTVAYAKPADFIRLWKVNNSGATVKIEALGILSDREDLKILYIYRNDNPNTYFAEFVTALATRIAAELCFTITESTSKSTELMMVYQSIRLPAAKAHDSQQGTPDYPRQDEWEVARVMGGNAVIAPPGAATWHPAW